MKTRINVQSELADVVNQFGAVYCDELNSWVVPDEVPIYIFGRFIPLTIELVPASNWEDNVRSQRSDKWDEYRRATYKRAGHACEICGETHRRMESHEVWDFDMETGVQKLTRLICLCSDCHKVKHWGLSAIKGEVEHVENHIMKINGWNKDDVFKYINEVFMIFDARNKLQWTLDLSLLDNGQLL